MFVGVGAAESKPVVFVHGLTGAATTWLPFVSALGGRTWYSLDLPGHGESGYEDHYSFDADADALVRFLELVSGPAIVVGHSRGGLVACLAGALRPELVLAVYLEDVTPLFWLEARDRDLPFLGSVSQIGKLATRAANQGRDVGWIAEQIAELPHDANSNFGSRLTAHDVADWAEAATKLDRASWERTPRSLRHPSLPPRSWLACGAPFTWLMETS